MDGKKSCRQHENKLKFKLMEKIVMLFHWWHWNWKVVMIGIVFQYQTHNLFKTVMSLGTVDQGTTQLPDFIWWSLPGALLPLIWHVFFQIVVVWDTNFEWMSNLENRLIVCNLIHDDDHDSDKTDTYTVSWWLFVASCHLLFLFSLSLI